MDTISPVDFLVREIDSIRMWQTIIVGHLFALDMGIASVAVGFVFRRRNGNGKRNGR